MQQETLRFHCKKLNYLVTLTLFTDNYLTCHAHYSCYLNLDSRIDSRRKCNQKKYSNNINQEIGCDRTADSQTSNSIPMASDVFIRSVAEFSNLAKVLKNAFNWNLTFRLEL